MKHRSVLKQKNKKHKSGHSQKNQFKDPKPSVSGPNVHNQKGQKDRRIQAAESRRSNQMTIAKLSKIVGSKNGPPKNVGILPCSASADTQAFLNFFHFQPEVEGLRLPSGTVTAGEFSCRIVPLPMEREIDAVIDVGKIADVIVLLFFKDEPLDEWGATAISVLKSIGLPQVMAAVASPSGEPIPRASLVNYRNYIQRDLPDVERILPISSDEDLAQFVRFLSLLTPKQISWKRNRPTVLIQNFEVNPRTQTIDIYGYLREAKLNIHQIVTIPYLGDYQIAEANDFVPADDLRHKIIYCQGDDDNILDADIRPPQMLDSDATVNQIPELLDKMQIDGDMEEMPQPEEFDENGNYGDDEAEAREAELRQRTQEELEFPDEFDQYDSSVLLRERLQRYRGIKSPWNKYESLPPQYSRIFEFSNYPRISESAIAEQDKGEIEPGARVKITLLNGDNDIDAWNRVPEGRALAMFGLFRNETLFTVLNATFMNKGPPVRSKENLLIVCGFRNMWIAPIFSEDNRSEKHLYLRVVPENGNAIASFIAPAVMQVSHISYFKEIDGMMQFIGTGAIKTVDPSRMILKRIILTGNPYRAEGKTARVTLMFYNKEDIEWFKGIELAANEKRGHIVEPIGLKGHFKAQFNKIVQQSDTISMSLYKRVFPKLETTAPVTF